MLEEHFVWTFATLEWVFNKGKYLKTHFPPLPVPGFIPAGVAWNMIAKQVSERDTHTERERERERQVSLAP